MPRVLELTDAQRWLVPQLDAKGNDDAKLNRSQVYFEVAASLLFSETGDKSVPSKYDLGVTQECRVDLVV
jgi:hypothetical protein